MEPEGGTAWAAKAVAAGTAAAGIAMFIALVGLATAAAAPRPGILGTAAEAAVAAAAAAAASTWLLGAGASAALAPVVAALDEAYRARRATVSHPERVAAADEVALLAAHAAAARRLMGLWGLAAASLGVGGVYSATAAYRALWCCSRRVGAGEEAPGPAAVAALMLATLGLGGLVAAGWAGRLAAGCLSGRRGGEGGELVHGGDAGL